MFSVIFEVLPNKENWDDYFDNAKMLRPELEQVEGFVDNIRYRSLTREGWILSLSNWRDEKSLVRWRTRRRQGRRDPPRLTPLRREGRPAASSTLRSPRREPWRSQGQSREAAATTHEQRLRAHRLPWPALTGQP